MNRTIAKSFYFTLVMMAILLVNASYIHVFKEEEYAQNPANRRGLIELKSQPRGYIATGGIILAESLKGEDGFYYRNYPHNPQAFGAVEGYISDIYGASGIESSYNDVLNGTAQSPTLWWKSLISQDKQVGNVELTLDPATQETAFNELASRGYEGAAVAIRPSTGEVLALASTPSFDPAAISDANQAELAWQELNANPGDPLLNKATQETLPPGSTFKVVTTLAALNKGFTPDSTLTGQPQITLPGTEATLENYGGQLCGGATEVNLLTAFQYSCNTAFVEMGIQAGADALRQAARDFGIGERYDLGLPVVPGTVGDLPDDPALGQSAIGQRDVALTVLQNAVIAATVANKGVRMEPHLIHRVVADDLTEISKTSPRVLSSGITEDQATTLTNLMQASERFTAGYAGQNIASKTGTAEHGEDSRNSNPHAWYIAFAPGEDIAVAVVVKNGGDLGQAATGGSVAAPIGRAIIAQAPKGGQ
ncbi:penicillin-binding protein 2 [Corynebacterium sp. ES2794-CONJ1]|uniref:penicillin-binding transpeptidase domain-containing protein n=1 Tax=unclassified Corynebacterium TaxID=2624378 RepID=UPI00216A6EA3|nr:MULTISPECIES: penicillin-binding protein 2 [unclassified Corynebacterium]MCS4490422.1 penicillin-binding protein 2 [Corynebacterium sp. ES2775-CONJ]MCS4492202.1 penicillin-binding protein 2 [Corynebacterium sp. ES2715-CONJ3]MCS4532316.1 penicillin-binding protein 2 [Corynebacterium sp. ES2730-CONJ]MCU9519721.1 penicillin-binding protein 2 [Corynebacterium sp. ES2794-CONJ1]